MTSWNHLFSVQIRHAFFADGQARGVRIEPDAATVACLAREGARIQAAADGLAVWAPETALPATRWVLSSADTLFGHVTDWPRRSGALAYLNAARARAQEDGTWVLTQGDTLAAADLRSVASPRVALPLRPAGARPATLAVLRIPRVAGSAATGRRYRLTLAARQAVWKYWLFGDWTDDDPQVVDPASQAEFTPPQRDRLDERVSGWSTRSTAPIALREHAPQRFQLRSRRGAGKVLIKRLPVAGTSQFNRETIDGVPTLVSEIFVYR